MSYYYNAKELGYRLQLLLGEIDAGNDNPQIIHEVQSILGELFELNLIE